MQKVLKTYLNRLINISTANRSLLLRRLLRDQYIDLHEFDFAHNKPSFDIIKDLIAGKSRVKLCPLADSRTEWVNILSRRLRKLQRFEQQLFEEHGSRDLYVGWPFVRGKFADGSHVRCPLIFFPVLLESDGQSWVLRQREGVNITLNKTFLVAYGHYNQVTIGEELLEQVFDDFDTDSMVFRTGLYQLFKESPVEINFNQDNFIDKLEPFKEYTKAQFEEEQKAGELKLFPEAVLGIFPQSGSYLVPDYEHIMANESFADLQLFFESKIPDELPGDRFGFLSRVKEEETYTPFKMDAYQENAIKAVKKGNSLVIQGPPGTGKSQVICNLIADYMARGKRVLLVCQKRAALDVVYQRFEELEMSDFLGLVHDFKNDRKQLYEKIDRQIKHIDFYKASGNSLDALQLERSFLQYARRIDQITEELEEFKAALYDEQECGLSAKELYLTSDLRNTAVDLKQLYRNFNMADLLAVYTRIRNYAAYALRFRQPDYPLLDRQSFATHTISDLQKMQTFLSEIEEIKQQVGVATREVTGHEVELEDCLKILDRAEHIKQFIRLIRNKQVYKMFTALMQASTKEEDLLWLADHERIMLESFAGEGIEASLPSARLGEFQKTLQKAIEARRNFFKFLYWRLFARERKWVREVLRHNNLGPGRKDFKRLVSRIDNRLNLEHNLTVLNEKGWVPPYAGKLQKGALQNWLHALKQAFRAKLIFLSLRNFTEYFNVQQLTANELIDKLDALFRRVIHIPEYWERWQLYFTPAQLRKLTTDPAWFEEFARVLPRDFEALCDFDKLQQEMPAYEIQAANKVMDEADFSDPEEVAEILDNSLRLQWLEHIETKYPVLRSVSSMKFKQLESELQECVKEKLRLSKQILTLRAREQVYENVEYNRLQNMVTYRELGHQVTKQRRIWPLRRLIGRFSDELFQLIPCWLASPETVSAVFPMSEMFDLVIFDEASQCFTEKGIPAMYRGRQLVVAGDNKQLRPNDLYRVRLDKDEDELALEVDSLLELAAQYLMDVQLQGHYRSQKPELIAFSNRHFYHDKLRMLPDRTLVNNPEPAISYIKVEGIWENQTNRVEAERVVELVAELMDQQPGKSIGIVTFNARQQDMVLDVLDRKAMEEGLSWPPSLIVKNIENIQGDEKDIIIFTTAYAPDAKGRLVMQFGSLNQPGGENRLNVAVTRAREKIFVVSSIWPQQLKVDKTKNQGPKLLRSYLEFARQVSEGGYRPVPPAPAKDREQWYLKTKLATWFARAGDCQARSELPFADITIVCKGLYLGLIATDDDLYYQSPSIKDAHVYTPLTLSAKQWKYKGMFSRNYWLDPEATEEELRIFISQVEQS